MTIQTRLPAFSINGKSRSSTSRHFRRAAGDSFRKMRRRTIRAVAGGVSPVLTSGPFQVESGLLAKVVGKLDLLARVQAMHHQRMGEARLILPQHVPAEGTNGGRQHQRVLRRNHRWQGDSCRRQMRYSRLSPRANPFEVHFAHPAKTTAAAPRPGYSAMAAKFPEEVGENR